ncbi:MAG: PD-(D/E)XK nuclease family transposase [Chitinophagales bacterium]|nr:PD-(D/E)XK nuclease family transposase [Chitinophagales bacterium]
MSIAEKYINPFTDFGFKKLFGTEPNKDLLIDFLNQVLPEKHQIHDLTYARTEHLGNSEADRKAVLEMPNFNKSEAELETNFDRWMYVLQHLPSLENRPAALKDRVFQKVFETAEIAKFSPDDKAKYEESLKYYRDLKNVVDTSYEEGKAEGKAEGKEERNIEIARQMKSDGESLEKIMRYTGLSAREIENI